MFALPFELRSSNTSPNSRTFLMLNSVLLYLEDERQAAPVIRCGVELAKKARARVRGVTLLDTRLSEEAYKSESAAYAMLANSSHVLAEHQQDRVRLTLSNACLKAGLNFDVRRFAGNPIDVLAREGRYHDLIMTAGYVGGGTAGLCSADLSELLERGVQPLLVLHPSQDDMQRVLLVYDGTEKSGRAIRSYLNLGLLPKAEYRLLAIGDNYESAQGALREMADYCRMRCESLETGCVEGKLRRVLSPYVDKWQADLMVLGMERGNRFFRRVFGETSFSLLPKS
jgi:nucleotide-binding universal stress UspA family protein